VQEECRKFKDVFVVPTENLRIMCSILGPATTYYFRSRFGLPIELKIFLQGEKSRENSIVIFYTNFTGSM